MRPGWLYGFGRGWGLRWGGYPYNPWVCARFPWLPRWWWAYPGYYTPWAYGGYPWAPRRPYGYYPTPYPYGW